MRENVNDTVDIQPYRRVIQVVKGMATRDGAGVRLRRYIGSPGLPYLDPFLMLDEFGSDRPDDYIAGFPSHPHRGMETVTYMLEGRVEHADHLGNRGVIGKGDAQWMTAGSGIIHSEMPAIENGLLRGLQFWVNLPAAQKMGIPKYRELKAEQIPLVEESGVGVRVLAGQYHGTDGAFGDIAGHPIFLDVTVEPRTTFACPIMPSHNSFVYVFEGSARFGDNRERVDKGELGVLSQDGDAGVQVVTESSACRFMLLSGQPLNEPVARGGPFVMNTEEEIRQAWREIQNGTFVKAQPELGR